MMVLSSHSFCRFWLILGKYQLKSGSLAGNGCLFLIKKEVLKATSVKLGLIHFKI